MAKEEKEQEGAPAQEEVKPAKSGMKTIIIVVVVAVVAIAAGAGGAFFMLKGGESKEAVATKGEEASKNVRAVGNLDTFLVNLDTPDSYAKVQLMIEYDPNIKLNDSAYKIGELGSFLVNLAEPGNFLKTTVMVQYNPKMLNDQSVHGGGAAGGGEKKEEVDPTVLPPEFKEREPMIRDAVIRVLSSKKPEELLTPEGKDALKEELIEAINDALGTKEQPVTNIYFKEFIIQ